MSEALPVLQTGVSGAEEEARATVATLIAQILTLVRAIISYIMEVIRRMMQWVGEHPLATILMVGNICIWVS